MLTKTAYIEGTTLQLDLWGYQFHVLEDRVARSTTPARGKLNERLKALKRKRRKLKRRLHEATLVSNPDWNEKRGELEEAVRDFRDLAGTVYDEIRRVRS